MRSTTGTSIAPWLALRDAQRAVDYYKAAFGAVEVYRLAGDDGTLEVAQLSIGERCSGSKTTSTPALTAGAQDRFG